MFRSGWCVFSIHKPANVSLKTFIGISLYMNHVFSCGCGKKNAVWRRFLLLNLRSQRLTYRTCCSILLLIFLKSLMPKLNLKWIDHLRAHFFRQCSQLYNVQSKLKVSNHKCRDALGNYFWIGIIPSHNAMSVLRWQLLLDKMSAK